MLSFLAGLRKLADTSFSRLGRRRGRPPGSLASLATATLAAPPPATRHPRPRRTRRTSLDYLSRATPYSLQFVTLRLLRGRLASWRRQTRPEKASIGFTQVTMKFRMMSPTSGCPTMSPCFGLGRSNVEKDWWPSSSTRVWSRLGPWHSMIAHHSNLYGSHHLRGPRSLCFQ